MKHIKAFILDFLLIAYIVLLLKKLIYEKLVLAIYELSFEWAELFCISIVATTIALIFSFFPSLSMGRKVQGLKPTYSILNYILLSIAFVLTFIAGIHFTQISFLDLFSESGREGAQRIFNALVHPNFKIFESALFAIIETVYMAFMATVIAIPLAFVLSFFAAKNLMSKSWLSVFFYYFLRGILNFTRSIEPIVWAIVFTVWVGIGPFAGMLALVVHSIASLTKLYSEQIESINEGPIEAIKSTGAHQILVVWYGVVPQIIIPFLSFTIYRWDINVRMATVIGLVGGGGIGTMLMQYTGLAKWNEVGLILLLIASVVWMMDYASAKIRENIK